MLKIWGRANSTNVKKVLWIAEELGLAYERVDLGGAFGGLDDPAYRALNPNGLVPALQDGETILWESNVIVRYLAAAYGQGRLWIDDPADRAQAEKWMDWAATTIYDDFRAIMMNLIRLPEDKRDPSRLQHGLAGMAASLRIADAALAGQPWLSGASFGLGDIPLGCYVHAWYMLPVERPALPHLENWYDRLSERPAYRKVVMTPLT